MVHDGLSVNLGCAHERALDPGRLSRLAARLRPGALDRAIIAGADPAASAQLAARVAQLSSPSARAQVADGLEHLLAAADGPPFRWRVVPRRAAILSQADELRELASLLRGPAALYARGIAMLRALVTDGAGPAYVSSEAGTFAERLRTARAAMFGRPAPVPLVLGGGGFGAGAGDEGECVEAGDDDE